MMVSMSCEVNFRVRAKTRPGETVCLVGDSPELGTWDPHRAIILRQETKKLIHTDSEACFEECSEDGDIWSKTLQLEGFKTHYYRYFICRLFQSDSEDDGGRSVLVKWWEGHIKPRRFSPKEAMSETEEGAEKMLDVFGNFDGIRSINRGWLIDQVEVQLQLHGEPLAFWKPKYSGQTYSIKCTPIDHSYKKTLDDKYEMEMLGDSLPECHKTELLVSVLEKGRSKPRPQSKFGPVVQQNSFVTFHAQTSDPESLGFQLDLYVDEDNKENETARHVGSSFILPLSMKKSRGSKNIPINGNNNRPIGQLTYTYLLIKPMYGPNTRISMERTFQRYWKSTRKPVDVGHRGLGSSYKCKKLAIVQENTIRSFQTAANHGADFVEFDVHLTKDEIPIIYHDFKVLITYRKKKREDLELFEIPVKDITFAELQQMKLSHPASTPEYKYEGIQDDDVEPEDTQPFPSLEQVFRSVDIHTGFNIEIKYPQAKVDGSGKIKDYFDLNRFVDIILSDVFKNHGGRRIVFSSFEPDICSMLRLKQNVFPVLFLSQADTSRYVPYAGIRTQSVVMATEFALSAGLLGVDVISDMLVKDMSQIRYVKDAGLVLFVWGEGCNDKEFIIQLKENKVDGIIYDRIDFYKTGPKESIFKLEEKQKRHLLETLGSLTITEESLDSGTDSP
ncbi:glycerophosphocholine phosphodiesterase GPCPD1-like isoform X2 [Mya arenaria]|uniref:glycerophosphocholine phosphodiesterase GPCPD1-like isoform X2 n=1 Tax=Mya arenaria TaxID=6604 RepID=UPI0022E60356|nr:glycerophosphocholine phosphodiesterase GPCPD1-like isoform X2 [Mya arenaria]